MIPADLQANFIFWKSRRKDEAATRHGGHHEPSERFAMRLALLQVRCTGVE